MLHLLTYCIYLLFSHISFFLFLALIQWALFMLKKLSLTVKSRSRVNSISKNEMNIRISLCNVRRVNGMLDISLEIVPKKTDVQF